MNSRVLPEAIEILESQGREYNHYVLVSWFGIAYLVIYLLHITSVFSILPIPVKLTFAGFVFCMGLLCVHGGTKTNFFTESSGFSLEGGWTFFS